MYSLLKLITLWQLQFWGKNHNLKYVNLIVYSYKSSQKNKWIILDICNTIFLKNIMHFSFVRLLFGVPPSLKWDVLLSQDTGELLL